MVRVGSYVGKKEYWLIKRITTIGHRNPLQVVDRIACDNLRNAEAQFKARNNFPKLMEKSDLTITEAKKWFV